MNQDKQGKSKITKSQIELIKQKYLKKNNGTKNTQQMNTVSQNKQQKTKSNQVQTRIDSKNEQKNNANYQQPDKQQKIFHNKQRQNKQNKEASAQWSLKSFLQQQCKNYNQQRQKQGIVENELESIKFDEKDPFCLKIPFRFSIQRQTQNKINDPEFQQQKVKLQNDSKINSELTARQAQKDLIYACKLWTEGSQKCLYYLLSTGQNIDVQQIVLELRSSNPSFPGIVKQLAEQFIFNNDKTLKQSQKQVVYNMALQYFSPSPNELSDVLLVSLIKLAPSYSHIYADQIIRRMGYYSSKIIRLKRYYLKQELENFLKFLQERIQVLRTENVQLSNLCFLWLLILRPNSNYSHQVLLARNVQKQVQLMIIFCALFPQSKQSALSILYLKCIDSLIPLFIRAGTLEKVILHLNEIKIPQLLYQPVKSLKLKLIRAGDTKKEKKKVQQDKVFGVFMGQKITKIREVLENKVNSKSKAEVYYNPSSGKYQQLQTMQSSKISN